MVNLLVGILIHFRVGSCRVVSITSHSSLANGMKGTVSGTVSRQANAIRAEYTISRATFSWGLQQRGCGDAAENVASARGRVKLQAQHSSKALVHTNHVKRIVFVKR